MKYKIKHFTALFLAMCLILTMMPINSFAGTLEEDLTPKYGSSKKFLAPIESPISGSIAISSRSDLEKIGVAEYATTHPLNGNYHLTADINLAGTPWVPIGTDHYTYFSGTFDGQGHVIKGLTLSPDIIYNGLFGYIGSTTIIKNIGLENVNINFTATKTQYIGGLCGYSTEGTFTNCYSAGGNISVSTENDIAGSTCYIGTFCAYFGSGSASNCYNTSSLTASSEDSTGMFVLGGICSINAYSSINNCYNTGNLTASSAGASYLGGICYSQSGSKDTPASIRNCYNTGDIYSDSRASEAGGVCSYGGSSYDTLMDCYNTGNVTALSSAGSSYAGGICADRSASTGLSSPIENCYNTGDVKASSTKAASERYFSYSFAGGICGSSAQSNNVYINNCYNEGDISANSDADPYAYAGGIFGYSQWGGIVTKCYNNGKAYAHSAEGRAYAGGIGGRSDNAGNQGTIKIDLCYNTGEVAASSEDSSSPFAGGIAGALSGYVIKLSNSYNCGSISSSSSYGYTYVGGICGQFDSNEAQSYINTCYNAGAVTFSDPNADTNYYLHSGGFAGWVMGSVHVPQQYSNCYWNSDSPQTVNGLPQEPKLGIFHWSELTTALSSAQMKKATFFVGFDFNDVWGFKDGMNDGYPVLRHFVSNVDSNPDSHTVVYNKTVDNGTLNATIDGTPVASGVFVEDDMDIIFTATPKNGYRVKGWSLNGNPVTGTDTYTLSNVTADATVAVEFEVIPPKSKTKAITSFTIMGIEGIINESNSTIQITVPFETNITSLTPSITHTGAMINPGGAIDFSSTVKYIVTAEDGSVKNYYVTVKKDTSIKVDPPNEGLTPTQTLTPIESEKEATLTPSSTPSTDSTIKNVTKIDTPLKTVYIANGNKFTIPLVIYSGNTQVVATLTWKSSNEAVATVSCNGVVTMNKNAKKGQKTTITATAENGKKLAITVYANPTSTKLTRVTVTAPKSLKVGKTKKLIIKLGNKKATWSKITFKSSKASGLSVNKTGKLTAKKKGKYTITIKVDKVTVKKKIVVK